ncbi:MAG: hypothetical protein PUB11_04030 [Oscillospiraceae bacterium]|nr:hypothetical protein [Oscillospiraceae bacterium]
MFFKKKNPYFGTNIPPACEYCEFGEKSSDKAMILCSKKGVVSPYYSCNKYSYMPTKRIPKRRPSLREYSSDDFKL